LHGAVNTETMEMTVNKSQTINWDSTVQLSGILDKKYSYLNQLFVILASASYYNSQEVRDVIETNPILKLVYLPPN